MLRQPAETGRRSRPDATLRADGNAGARRAALRARRLAVAGDRPRPRTAAGARPPPDGDRDATGIGRRAPRARDGRRLLRLAARLGRVRRRFPRAGALVRGRHRDPSRGLRGEPDRDADDAVPDRASRDGRIAVRAGHDDRAVHVERPARRDGGRRLALPDHQRRGRPPRSRRGGLPVAPAGARTMGRQGRSGGPGRRADRARDAGRPDRQRQRGVLAGPWRCPASSTCCSSGAAASSTRRWWTPASRRRPRSSAISTPSTPGGS